MNTPKHLRRSNNRMISGVAAGVAEYFDLDPTLARLGFVLLALIGGHGLLIYLVLWALMPPAVPVTQ